MPVIKSKSQTDNERSRANEVLRSNLNLLRREGVGFISAAEIRRDKLTLQQLFARVNLKSSQVADALPAADSTVRGFLTGRKEPALPMSLQHRLLQQLRCDWEGFRLAWQHSSEARQDASQASAVRQELEEAERDALAVR